jgi:enamine deaminase RidA (YjgF/YER057c/UK114 family)
MPPKMRFLNPESLVSPPGYTHVVEATAPGRMIFIAGQLGIDRGGRVAGAPGDFRAQAVQAFENLKAALAAVGAQFEHVVKINNYLTDMAHLAVLREVRDRYLNTAAPPASTTVAISSLAHADALFEIDAIAILPSG